MHISKKLEQARKEGQVRFSFEYFPPKTAQGVQNLYDRMDRMHDLGPSFVDVTWGAGGSSSDLTTEMVKVAQSTYGLETCMHLTCTDMPAGKVDEALEKAYNAGCTNILALRGDPPREQTEWTAVEGGFQYARDLIKYIKKKYGDHFDIGIAGYPEGMEKGQDKAILMQHLKEKVDAGGTFIVTQMFYDAENFIQWMKDVRAAGIDVPILPGIMPIQTHAAFLRRANWSEAKIPPSWTEALEPFKNDDAEVRRIGRSLVAEMCRKLIDAGIFHLHFYTMNLAQSSQLVLEELGLIGDDSGPQKSLPWRQSLGLKRREESVRPIFWANRHKSYVARTQDWDEFPNGRWGDARSPAFGHLDAYNIGLKGTNEANRKLWGEPKAITDVGNTFAGYLEGKVKVLPWTESGLSSEINVIKSHLIDLNKRCFFTINSQPAVDGAPSDDKVNGWGPKGGYCYQKAYLELFVPHTLIDKLVERVNADIKLTFYAVNKAGTLRSNAPPEEEGPNAVTWGVFPGKEIIQPTIVEKISFLAWKDEAFKLGTDWARCYDAGSESRHVLDSIMDNWYLVNIVDNDFRRSDAIYHLFDGLVAPGSSHVAPTAANGTNGTNETNGIHDLKTFNEASGSAVPVLAS